MIMQNEITQYIAELNRIYRAGNATEHTYRPALKRFLENINPDLTVTNEPKRIACGAPDYIVTRGEIPIGYIEAKDIGVDLQGKTNKEQFDRYRQSLDNLIITDYLTFKFFKNGELVTSATIAKTNKKGIETDMAQFETFVALINHFIGYEGRGIRTSLYLSKVMAAKAKLMANIIENTLNINEKGDDNSLDGQLNGFRDVLIHDITHKEFANIYAQTIAYGMFAAKLNDKTDDMFTRAKAAQLIPQSNPFLRKLFQYVAGYDLDERICWLVDDLADLFNYVDIDAVIMEFGESDNDPIIHFYETFLAEYDPALRKSRGVWYTPQPVVQFIVQAVDDILKQEFELQQGLADTSKVKLKQRVQQKDGSVSEKEIEYHRVQIFDPATGTGTFLAEVVRNIHEHFKSQQGMWKSYANEHLIPRINGFEILMASYAVAHLKLDMQLQKTGFRPTENKRFHIYLTNSLEEANTKTETLFAKWLSDEANEASRIKQDVQVMIVLGNPPYSGISQNNGKWITDMIEDYKYIDGIHFNERKHWLQDDYVKFIRYGQHFIETNGEGILAYINNHGFLNNPTFRGMRWNLLQTFDTIYILDLHGNAKKKETAPDGGKDENVFDIQQGVSINIFVKTGKKSDKQLAEVFHSDIYGKREIKYNLLLENTLTTIKWEKINCKEPYFFFVPKLDNYKEEYEKGFIINDLFIENVTGIVTMGDNFIIANNRTTLKNRISKFLNNDYTETMLNDEFGLGKNYAKWILGNKSKIKIDDKKFVEINYRPFDKQWTYFDNKLLWRWRENVMQHFLKGENTGLMVCRQQKTDGYYHCLIHENIVESSYVSNKTSEIGYVFPLYLYQENFGVIEKMLNMKKEIINKIAKRIGLRFTDVGADLCVCSHLHVNDVVDIRDIGNIRADTHVCSYIPSQDEFSPINLLDYIYAVLHSPAYRERYKEFLKIDFPRIPYPQDAAQFWDLAALGAKLRHLHLMDNVEPLINIATYPQECDNKVERPIYESNKVWINDVQYFDNVPSEAWNFYIGGYQPAQKWLKDRKGRTLGYEDIVHYQRIIAVLCGTNEIMNEIDEINN
jgi:predicted helicase